MEKLKQFQCDTENCTHWRDGSCGKSDPVAIREHCCADYEERIVAPCGTVTIEVSGGVVQNVYASPDLPEISVELIDFDNLREEPDEVEEHARRLLKEITRTHNCIF